VAKRGRKPFSSEKLATLQECIDDGWPLRQIQETHGVSHRSMKTYFPDYRGETDYELAGKISKLCKEVGL
jgi:hypothetical protein